MQYPSIKAKVGKGKVVNLPGLKDIPIKRPNSKRKLVCSGEVLFYRNLRSNPALNIFF